MAMGNFYKLYTGSLYLGHGELLQTIHRLFISYHRPETGLNKYTDNVYSMHVCQCMS